jgi:hypothetical protein
LFAPNYSCKFSNRQRLGALCGMSGNIALWASTSRVPDNVLISSAYKYVIFILVRFRVRGRGRMTGERQYIRSRKSKKIIIIKTNQM